MTHTTQDPVLQENQGHPALFGLAIAGAIAVGLGFFLRSEKGQEARKELQAKVSKVFGELTDDLEASYLEVQGRVLADVHSAKKGFELTKEKFDDLVEKAVNQFSKERKWSEGVAKELKTSLKQDWKEIEAQF